MIAKVLKAHDMNKKKIMKVRSFFLNAPKEEQFTVDISFQRTIVITAMPIYMGTFDRLEMLTGVNLREVT